MAKAKQARWGSLDFTVAINAVAALTVQMNTKRRSKSKSVARVAIDVRLYFDVSIASEGADEIRRAAYAEFERVEEGERVRIKKLRHPNVYLREEWSDLSPDDFQICQRCQVSEANSEPRFPL